MKEITRQMRHLVQGEINFIDKREEIFKNEVKNAATESLKKVIDYIIRELNNKIKRIFSTSFLPIKSNQMIFDESILDETL